MSFNRDKGFFAQKNQAINKSPGANKKKSAKASSP